MTQNLITGITSVLTQASEAHHEYEQNILKGQYDEDWAIWYAEYVMVSGLGKLLDRQVTPEQLSQFLSQSYKEYKVINSDQSWAEYTAQKIVANLITTRENASYRIL